MSRNSSRTMAANIPAALRPAPLRAGLTLAVIAALTAFAIRAQAQAPAQSAFHARPVVGALVATGEQRALLKNAVLVGAQASYQLHSDLAIVGSFAWLPSEDKTAATQAKLDVYQYDVGLEGQAADLTPGTALSTRPYVVIGAGARTYNLRQTVGTGAQTNPLAYAAVGVDLDLTSGRLGLRLEARDNVTAFKGLRGELEERKARNDLQFAAGVTFGF